jgi:cytochrome c-type biogenesis protein CcmF
VSLIWLGRAFIYAASAAFVIGVLGQVLSLLRGRRAWPVAFATVGFASLLGAVAVMQFSLITHDFSLRYVAENNATFTPFIYSVTGMWSDLEGSILLWAILLAALSMVVVLRYRREATDSVVKVASAVMFGVAGFFTLLMAGPADPFAPNPAAHPTGAGPNALLQDNPLVAIHPPLLYLGFVGFTVPFAFAVAMLITGRVDDRWPLEQRRWTVLAWGSLSLGIVLGAWWSYQVLGWGGFWGWDPVENAALLPWLTATAYVHSVVVQDRRGLFRTWNLSLAIATFALTILGTFFTRSGILQSVHAFSSSTLGPLLISFFLVVVGGSVALLIWRGDKLRSPVGVDSPFSREGLFVANNVLFVGFAIVVLLGTVFPLIYEAVNGEQVTVGTPYFASVAVPVSVALLVLMAVAPLVGWRRADPDVLWRRARTSAWVALGTVVVLLAAGVRHPLVLGAIFLAVCAAGAALRTIAASVVATARRREPWWRAMLGPSTGGMVVHLGVVILTIGIVVSTSYTSRHEVPLRPGESAVVAGQVLTFEGLRHVATAQESGTAVDVRINSSVQLAPSVTRFRGRASQPVGTPAIDSNMLRDVYLTFDAIGSSTPVSGPQVVDDLPVGAVLLGVTVEPLLSWLWIGGVMIGLGSALAFARRPVREAVR